MINRLNAWRAGLAGLAVYISGFLGGCAAQQDIRYVEYRAGIGGIPKVEDNAIVIPIYIFESDKGRRLFVETLFEYGRVGLPLRELETTDTNADGLITDWEGEAYWMNLKLREMETRSHLFPGPAYNEVVEK